MRCWRTGEQSIAIVGRRECVGRWNRMFGPRAGEFIIIYDEQVKIKLSCFRTSIISHRGVLSLIRCDTEGKPRQENPKRVDCC